MQFIGVISVVAAFVCCGRSNAAEIPLPSSGQSVYGIQGREPAPVDLAHAAEHGINIQTGYEGYLVPGPTAIGESTSILESIGVPFGSYVSALLPSHHLLKVVGKVIVWSVIVVALFLAGSVFTTAVCAFTPFCDITFHGAPHLNEESVRAFVTPERLSTLSKFVNNAIKKYESSRKN